MNECLECAATLLKAAPRRMRQWRVATPRHGAQLHENVSVATKHHSRSV